MIPLEEAKVKLDADMSTVSNILTQKIADTLMAQKKEEGTLKTLLSKKSGKKKPHLQKIYNPPMKIS